MINDPQIVDPDTNTEDELNDDFDGDDYFDVEDEDLNAVNAPVNEVVALEEKADPESSPFVEGDPHAKLEAEAKAEGTEVKSGPVLEDS